MLDWSKLERDAETSSRPVALDIRTVCESILVLLPNKDDEAEVELMVVVEPNVPRSVFLDETYIHRILMNLLSNALKFTRSGYILLLIEIKDGNLVATVKDTGSGVPSSFLPQLFEPFKQAQTRGSQRGTGLGLSIVKQLLRKMGGSITVESKHSEGGEIEPARSGSTFIISIPVQVSAMNGGATAFPVLPKIAMFHAGNEGAVEGLQTAWETFGFIVVLVNDLHDLSGTQWTYIWADLPFLRRNSACLQGLINHKTPVLVPYDSQNTLNQLPEIISSSNFIPLPRPLIWHSIAHRIAARQEPKNSELLRTVRFASTIEIVDPHGTEQAQKPIPKNLVVLLVEDNPINQKLGKKMLDSLGYEVQIAENGQEAIDLLTKDNADIDVILMDQSMPQMDGITATRKVRELEIAGTISRRIPIVALTAVVSSEAQSLFTAAGADAFLSKPLSLVKLDQTLAEHLPTK